MNYVRSGTLGVPVLASMLFVVLSVRDWVGEWNWTIDVVNGSVILGAPVVAGLAAFIGLSVRRSSSLLMTTPREPWILARTVVAVWVVGCAAFALTALLAIGMTMASVHGGPVAWWALVLGPATLANASSIGVAVGFLLPRVVVAALTGPLYFVVSAMVPPSVEIFFRQGPVTGSLAGLTYSPRVAAATIAGSLAIPVLFIALARLRTLGSRLLAAASVVVLISAIGVSQSANGYRFVPSGEGVESCETVSEVRICVASSNKVHLTSLTSVLSEALAILKSTGADVPERFDALVPYMEPAPGRGMLLSVGPFEDLGEAAIEVLYPEPCAQWFDPTEPPPNVVADSQELIALILVDRAGGSAPEEKEYGEWLRSTSRSVQDEWVRETYRMLRSCNFGKIAVPEITG